MKTEKEKNIERLEKEVRRLKQLAFLKKCELVVLTEGQSDKEFWKSTFSKATAKTFLIFSSVNYPTSETSGKDNLIVNFIPYTDNELIVCVDSDYDYLLEKAHLKKPFVFQTYLFAIENYWSLPEGLKSVVEKHTNTEGCTFDFVGFYESYSKVVYDVLCYSLYSISKPLPHSERLTEEPCASLASLDSVSDIDKALKQLEIKIQKRITLPNSDEFQLFKKQLVEKGLTPQNSYLFLHSKTIFNNLALKIAQKVAKELSKSIEAGLRKKKDLKAIEAYQKYKIENDLKELLKQNTAIDSHPFYQQIIMDIQTSFKK